MHFLLTVNTAQTESKWRRVIRETKTVSIDVAYIHYHADMVFGKRTDTW